MKCIKLTYKSPMFGSVSCEDLESFSCGHIDLSPETMEQIHHRSDELGNFLRKHMEDLVDHVPEQLKDIVVKAEFGDFTFDDFGMCFLTEIYVRRMPDALESSLISEWITGQMSDGWGESLEQREFMLDRVEWTQPSFNEDEGIWESEEFLTTACYYVHSWTDKFYLDLIDDMVVEIDVPQEKELADLKLALEEIKKKIRELEIYVSNHI